MKALFKVEQLPLIPENWEYQVSIAYLKPKIQHWKQETYEIASELHIAREILSREGRPKKLGNDFPVLTWAKYCEDIKITKRTANLWIAMVFGPLRSARLPLPKIESQVLYADPPWTFNNNGFIQSAAQQYPVLTLEEICKYSDGERTVRQLANEKRSVLFLWVPEALIPEGLEVVKAWGFQYKAQMVWAKDRSPGMGWWVKSKHELLFIGSKGEELHPAVKYDSVFESPVRAHSQKPDEVYSKIEAMYTGPYIELFARKQRQGWKSWGNEVAESS